MKRSSNSRIWKEARTRMAMSSSETPARWACFDRVADDARLLLAVPNPGHGRTRAHRRVSEQGLAEPALIMGDQPRGDRENVAARAVVALEPDDLRTRKIPLEAQDIVDVRAPPAVDRLVVVADAAQIAVGPGEQAQPQILDNVRILIFVDQDVAEAALETREDVAVFAKEPQRFEQEIAEVDGVQRLETGLVHFVERRAAAARETRPIRSPARDADRARGFSSCRSGSPAPAPASACRRDSRPAGSAS